MQNERMLAQLTQMNKLLLEIEDELDTLNRIMTEFYYLYGDAHNYKFDKEEPKWQKS